MFLGIDIGTSKVAAVIADAAGTVLAVTSSAHRADLPGPPGRSEQDASTLVEAALNVVCKLPAELRKQVRAVGATGQMHGVVVLNKTCRALTPLITWQDRRCGEDEGFLPGLIARTGYSLSTGFGCATLAWLAARCALPAGAATACTIHDLLVGRLCGLDRPITDTTDAASFGLFAPHALTWDAKAVAAANIPAEILPEVHPCPALAGTLAPASAESLGLPAGIPVAVAFGDNQASMFATLRRPNEQLSLTLGTGGQISAVMPADAQLDFTTRVATFEYRPYPGERWAMVAASLGGGSAWAWLAEAVKSWTSDLGCTPPPDDELYARINELGLSASGWPVVRPFFFGERHDPSLRGGIEGISSGNFTLGQLARGLAMGIVTNLRDMLPPDVLAARTELVGSGNALRKNAMLRRTAEEAFGLPLVLSEGQEEAATGAAILAGRLIES
ncbi:MAG: hypothetical protein HQ546_11180 [Planctomycetes bacterium]|nr:hypothetical protein [Planctomycetota bacterium]